jgi:hypothetical protein
MGFLFGFSGLGLGLGWDCEILGILGFWDLGWMDWWMGALIVIVLGLHDQQRSTVDDRRSTVDAMDEWKMDWIARIRGLFSIG